MHRICVGLMLSVVLVGCGGGSGSTPTGSSAAATAVTVDFQDVLRVGRTATARGTATMTNGQSQSVGSGWRSDAPAVATATDAGSVTGVGNGEASIYVVFGGIQGAKRIRVVPDYDGNFSGSQVITQCSASGDWVGICDDPDFDIVGRSYPVALTMRHGDSLAVAGEFTVDGQIYPTFNSQVGSDGSLQFSGSQTIDDLRAVIDWTIASPQNSRVTGTIREAYSAPTLLRGEVVWTSDLTGFGRTGITAGGSSGSTERLTSVARRYVTRRGR